jgi:hypothetical protein
MGMTLVLEAAGAATLLDVNVNVNAHFAGAGRSWQR